MSADEKQKRRIAAKNNPDKIFYTEYDVTETPVFGHKETRSAEELFRTLSWTMLGLEEQSINQELEWGFNLKNPDLIGKTVACWFNKEGKRICEIIGPQK